MNKLKTLLLMVIILNVSSCGSKKEEVKEYLSKTRYEYQIIGVGYTEDLAESDSYSTFFAVKQGVRYQIKNGEVKFNLNSGKGSLPPIEILTNSKIDRIDKAFFVYTYPFSSEMEISGYKLRTREITVNIKKPFSFLSKMLANAALEEYSKTSAKVKGTIYFLRMDWQMGNENSIQIRSKIVLSEDAPVN